MFTVLTVISLGTIQPQLEVVMPTDDQRLVNSLCEYNWVITEDRMTIDLVVLKSINIPTPVVSHTETSDCNSIVKHWRQKVPP